MTSAALCSDSPPDRCIGVAYFASLRDACSAVTVILTAGLVPSTLELLDAPPDASNDLAHIGLRQAIHVLLLIGDDGPAAAAANRLEWIKEICLSAGAVEVSVADHHQRRMLGSIKCFIDPANVLNLTGIRT